MNHWRVSVRCSIEPKGTIRCFFTYEKLKIDGMRISSARWDLKGSRVRLLGKRRMQEARYMAAKKIFVIARDFVR